MVTTMAADPVIVTTGTHFDSPEGGELYERDAKSDLFMAVTTTTDKDDFYELAEDRNTRIREDVRRIAKGDPGWLLRLVRWAREEGNMRRVPGMVTTELVKDRLERGVKDNAPSGLGLSRVAINVACARADEPSRILELWENTYGRPFPKPLKRGLGDACVRLYNERSCLKWDTDALRYRFGDVLEICHPKAKDETQGALFEWLLNRRHGRKASTEALPYLPVVTANTHVRSLMDTPESREMIRATFITEPETLKDAGMTWENLSSLGPMDAEAWQSVIPFMGYMALLRNLRNFDKVKISNDARALVRTRLSDPDEVERSRQFPFRFLSAYLNSDSGWHPTLEKALELSMRNVPALTGRTLLMLDCSASMWNRQEPSRAQQGGLFVFTLAKRAEDAVVWGFGSSGNERRFEPGSKVLDDVSHVPSLGGTDTQAGTRMAWKTDGPFDRVVIVTDEQSHDGDPGRAIPKDVPMYTWNLAGYRGGHGETGPTRHAFGGLTDQGFSMIPTIESGSAYTWPF